MAAYIIERHPADGLTLTDQYRASLRRAKEAGNLRRRAYCLGILRTLTSAAYFDYLGPGANDPGAGERWGTLYCR